MSLEHGDSFDPFTHSVPEDIPVRRLHELQGRAMHLLRNLSTEQIKSAKDDVHWMLAAYRDAEDKELAADVRRSDAIELERLSDLDALAKVLEQLERDEEETLDPNEWEELPDRPSTSVCLAILALEQIGRAVVYYSDDDWPTCSKEDLPAIRLQSIANDAIDIMEIVCWAEVRERLDQLRWHYFADSLAADLRVHMAVNAEGSGLAREKLSEVARNAANIRHKPTNEQRVAAIAEWEATSHTYSSPRAFARNRYQAFGVTDFMTVYNWLRDHRRSKT